jgi:hypothetical protein
MAPVVGKPIEAAGITVPLSSAQVLVTGAVVLPLHNPAS